jgi:hypothetical protein
LGLKVWVVEEGYYSDRGIGAIFSTEEKAKDYIKTVKQYSYNWSDVHDEPTEFDLDPILPNIKDYFPYNHFYWVEMDKGGFFSKTPQRGGIDIEDPERKKEHFYFKKSGYSYSNSANPALEEVVLEGFVNANDETHALKIINGKRKELLDQWPKLEDFDVWNHHINV